MKWIYKIIIPILAVCVAASGIITISCFNKINKVYEKGSSNYSGNNPRFHYSLILASDDDKYWQDFKDGAFEAGKTYNTAIEYNPVSDPDSDVKAAEYINIADKSHVDGIIANGENSIEYTDAIKNATKSGINTVVGVVETIDSNRLLYVGTNFYDYGILAAQLIKKTSVDNSPINLAVILSDVKSADSDKTAASQSDIMINGLKSVANTDPQINLVSTLYRNNDLLGAEDLTRNILTQHTDVNIIFCTNAKDTVATAQLIVKLNLVGKVKIVGTEINDDIKNYIKKGIVYGVLERNGKLAGFNSVKALYESGGSAFKTSYVNIGTDFYTLDNINQTS